MVNVFQHFVCVCFSMCIDEPLSDPINNVIFESTFDDLVEEVRGYHFKNVCLWKMCCEWLKQRIN